MSKIPEVSIVVPVFNSELTLPVLIKRVEDAFSIKQISFEVILVDDCSSDNSWSTIETLQKNLDFIIGIRNEKNIGQAYTSIKGISMAKGKFISTIDDDLEYNPEEIINLYHTILETDVDLVFGIAPNKYQLQGKNPYFAKLRNKILNFIWRKPLTDSFKIFKRTLVFDHDNSLLEVPFEVYLKRKIKEIRIMYHEVGYNKRFHGKSNYTIWKKLRLFIEMSFN
jgi:undecaprenyl-phosphate 4-deoxy-4-formamido-L-arabinose transferase